MTRQNRQPQINDKKANYSVYLDSTSGTIFYELYGCWDTAHIELLWEIEIPKVDGVETGQSYKKAILNCAKLETIDTAGALLIHNLLEEMKTLHIKSQFASSSKEIRETLKLIEHFYHPIPYKKELGTGFSACLIRLGQITIQIAQDFLGLVAFLGNVVCSLGNWVSLRQSFKWTSFVSHVEQVGINALPIVSLLSFLIGVVLAYQGITQLERFGAEIFTVNLLAVGILREVGILMTAIIVAGRSGSAFTAQIGTMVLNEEVAALQTMGENPINILVLPRIVALVFILPFLAFFSDIMGLLGGAFMTYVYLDLSLSQFMTQFKSALAPTTFWIGMVKAPFFAFIIGLVGCFEGLCVRSSAQSVGLHTTKSVVKAIFLVIVLDALFSIVFAQLKI